MISEKIVARYAELKLEAPGCVLLMQVGAFMKVLDEDARTVSGVTGLKLQMSGSVETPIRAPGENRPRKETRVGASRGDIAPLSDADSKT